MSKEEAWAKYLKDLDEALRAVRIKVFRGKKRAARGNKAPEPI